MAQLERRKKLSDSPKSPKTQTSPTFEQLLRVEEAYWSSNVSPNGRVCHDHEVCPNNCPSQNKKSVLSKVKETAKKLKYSLSGKRRQGIELHDDHDHDHDHPHPHAHAHAHAHSHDHHISDHVTPAWGATLEDDYNREQDDNPEYLGAPMYESEAAPESLKETARQHPRAEPVVSENHRAPNMTKHKSVLQEGANMITNTTHAVAEKLAPACAAVSDAALHINTDMIKNTTQTVADKLTPACTAMSNATHHINTNMITNTTHTVADKLAPACAVVSDATHQIASKIAGMAITSPEAQQETSRYSAIPHQEAKPEVMSEDAGNLNQCAGGSPQTYDKGVSVKEYFLNKLEPGEDERALSQAITEAISPRKSTRETGVVDKVKEAVTSFFRQEEGSNSTAKPADLTSAAPASSEVETIAQLNRVASICAEKTAGPSSAAPDTSNSPTVVQQKRVTSIHAEKPAIPSSATSDTSNIVMNAQQPQLNRVASVHVCSTKVLTDSSSNSPLIPLSTNAHEVYEEENHGRILQTN